MPFLTISILIRRQAFYMFERFLNETLRALRIWHKSLSHLLNKRDERESTHYCTAFLLVPGAICGRCRRFFISMRFAFHRKKSSNKTAENSNQFLFFLAFACNLACIIKPFGALCDNISCIASSLLFLRRRKMMKKKWIEWLRNHSDFSVSDEVFAIDLQQISVFLLRKMLIRNGSTECDL
jgi:hypothetical protein